MTAAGASMVEFNAGGPNDGGSTIVPNAVNVVEVLMFVECHGVIVPSEWVHAYVRTDEETFCYDGIRRRGDTLQASNQGE